MPFSLGQKTETPASGEEATILAILSSFKCIVTKKGDRMAFANFQDRYGGCEVVIFPKLFSKIEAFLIENCPFLVIGEVDSPPESGMKIKARELVPMENVYEDNGLKKTLIVRVLNELTEKQKPVLERLKKDGTCELTILYEENGKELIFSSKKGVSLTELTLKELKLSGFEVKIEFPRPKRNMWKSRAQPGY